MVAVDPRYEERVQILKEFRDMVPLFNEAHTVLERYHATLANGAGKKQIKAELDQFKDQIEAVNRIPEPFVGLVSKLRENLPPTPTPVTVPEDEELNRLQTQISQVSSDIPVATAFLRTLSHDIGVFKKDCENLASQLVLNNLDVNTISSLEQKMSRDIEQIERALQIENNEQLKKILTHLGSDVPTLQERHREIKELLGSQAGNLNEKYDNEVRGLLTLIETLIGVLTAEATELKASKQIFERLKPLVAQLLLTPNDSTAKQKAKADADEIKRLATALDAQDKKSTVTAAPLSALIEELKKIQAAERQQRRNSMTAKGKAIIVYNEYLANIYEQVDLVTAKLSQSAVTKDSKKREKIVESFKSVKPIANGRTTIAQILKQAKSTQELTSDFTKTIEIERALVADQYRILAGTATLLGEFVKKLGEM